MLCLQSPQGSTEGFDQYWRPNIISPPTLDKCQAFDASILKFPTPKKFYKLPHISSECQWLYTQFFFYGPVPWILRHTHSPIPLVWLKSPLTILQERPSPLQTPQRSSFAEEPMMPSQPIFWAQQKSEEQQQTEGWWVPFYVHNSLYA